MPTFVDNSGKTAISRRYVSAPMRWLLRNGKLPKGEKILDFGCGRGFDAYSLRVGQTDRDIWGYDPNWGGEENIFRSLDDLSPPYDIITCHYVLNVIESPADRLTVENEIISLLGPKGKGYISVRDDIKKEGLTRTGTWQGMVTPSPRWELLHHKKGGFRIYGYEV